MTGYVSLYKAKGGQTIKVKTLDVPPETRKFKVQGGIRKFKRVKCKQTKVEVILVAKSTKKGKGKQAEVTDDELDELETVDDLEEELDDLEDDDEEDEDEDDDDEDEEDDEDEDDDDEDEDEDDEDDDEDEDDEEEEAPKSKKKSKQRQSRAAANGRVGTAEVAEHCGVDARTLRMVLRKHKIEKDEESGRYEWKSLNHPTVKKVKKLIDKGEADNIKQESLQKLKDKKAAEKDAKAKTDKKGKKKGKKSKDEDETPKKKGKKKNKKK